MGIAWELLTKESYIDTGLFSSSVPSKHDVLATLPHREAERETNINFI